MKIPTMHNLNDEQYIQQEIHLSWENVPQLHERMQI